MMILSANTIEIIGIVISILSFLGFGTVIQMFVKDKHDKKIQNSQEAKERARKERQEEVREVIKEEIEPLKEELEDVKGQLKVSQEGTKAGLRNDILTAYYRCREKKGYRSDWDFENIHHLYDAYKKLKGNSFIEDVMKRFNDLPTKEEFLNGKRITKDQFKLPQIDD